MTSHKHALANGGSLFLALPIFASYARAQTFTTLYTFDGVNGAVLPNAVVIGGGGVLYGTSYGGGSASSDGTVFSLTPPGIPGGPWTETVLSSLTGADGIRPLDGVAIGSGGVLYATAFVGGLPDNGGTVFSSTPPQGGSAAPGDPWTLSVLHSFKHDVGGGFESGTSVVIGGGGVL